MLKSSLCDYSDAYILVSEITIITGREADQVERQENERSKGVVFSTQVIMQKI